MLIDPHRLTFKAIDSSGYPSPDRYHSWNSGRLSQTQMTSLIPDLPRGWSLLVNELAMRSTFSDLRDQCYCTYAGGAMYAQVLLAGVVYGSKAPKYADPEVRILPHDDDWVVPTAGHFTDWLRCAFCSLNEILSHPERKNDPYSNECAPYIAIDSRIRMALTGKTEPCAGEDCWEECDMGVQLVIHAYTSWYKKWDERGAPIRLMFQGAVLGGPQHQTEYIKKDGTLGYRDRYRGERL